MRFNFKTLIAASAGLALVVGGLAGCRTTGNIAEEALTIIIGTHAQSEDDPTWVDEITGEAAMNPDTIRAAETALAKVKEDLGVTVTWSQYSSDLTQLLLQTVLAGDPYCDLAVLWNGVQGRIMNQNILQPMDPYMDEVFFGEDDVDKAWIPIGKTFGSYYLMNRDLLFVNTWPICYNIDYIEAVPALRENGKTAYPADLYLNGEWTWNRFEDYLSKLKAYYNGRKGPVNSANDIVPFNTNYSYAALMAIASNGAAVYDGANMTFDSPEAKEAIAYMDKMISSELISCSSAKMGSSFNAGWLTATDAFINGETVFSCVARWKMDDAGAALASRGESMGIIPFPRPDALSADDPQYRVLSAAADSVGLMKGHDAERSRRALEAYATYKSEFYKAYARVDSIEEYRQRHAATEALAFGVDIFHPEIGDKSLEIFQEMGLTPVNDYSEAIGVSGSWSDIVGKAIYNCAGSPKYDIAVEANKVDIYKRLDDMSKALKKGEVVDDVVPGVNRQSNDSFIFASGTKPAKIDWSTLIKADDNVDGTYEIRQEGGKLQLRKFIEEDAVDDDGEIIPQEEWRDNMISVDYSGVDFEVPGKYTDGIVVTIKDYAGNKNEVKFEAYVYDDTSTTPPTLVLKEELPTLARNVDTATVNWGNSFVETAQDVSGVDIKSKVSADVSQLDVTELGVYPVVIYVEDFAGNKTSIPIEVEIK